MRKNNIPGIILLLMLVSTQAYPAVLLKASVDRNKITIGDKINYKITLEYDPKTEVRFPVLGGNLGEFEIKDYEVTGPKIKYRFGKYGIRKSQVLRHRYTLTTFTTGEYRIPEVDVEYLDRDGNRKDIKSGEITVFVESVRPGKNDKDDIRDLKKPAVVPRGWLFYVLLFGIPVLLAAGAFTYYYLYEKRKREEIFANPDLNRPADAVAYERLEKLAGLGLIAQGRVKEYYIILSEIIRKYLEQRYAIPVIDRTTGELYRLLREIPEIERKHCAMTKDFLEECDLVKFAKYVPEENTINADTETARKLIDLTRKTETVNNEPAESSSPASDAKKP